MNIREASSAHVNPEIYYEERVVQGPIAEVNLPEDKSIIIIGIPKSLNTPHIHSSGRIYRRLADQSKPKEETDRYILDELWKRSEKHKNKVSKRLTTIPDLPKAQENQTWAHIFFKPKSGQPVAENELKFDDFVRIVRNSDKSIQGVHAPMDSIYTAVNGYIARQTANNDPSFSTLTFRWWHDGSARFDIPFSTYTIEEFLQGNHKNKLHKKYIEIAIQKGYKELLIVDYSIFTQVAASMANCYIHMLDKINDERDRFSCFTLKNVFRTSPYADSQNYLDKIRDLSIPLTMDRDIVLPAEPNEYNMFYHRFESWDIKNQDLQAKKVAPFSYVAPAVFSIFQSVGIVSTLKEFTEDTDSWGFDKVNNVSS